jgi:hypothetical protein
MRRRSILLATALAPLAGCAALTPQTVVTDAQLIATKLASFIPLLNAIPGIPEADTALVTQLSGYISQAAALAGTLYTNVAPSAANTTIQNIEKAITGALAIATVPPVSLLTATVPGLTLALEAANVLTPALFAAFGLPAPVSASFGMTQAQARAILSAS